MINRFGYGFTFSFVYFSLVILLSSNSATADRIGYGSDTKVSEAIPLIQTATSRNSMDQKKEPSGKTVPNDSNGTENPVEIQKAEPVVVAIDTTELLTVPAGTFTMGRSDSEATFTDELPRHSVALDKYQIGKYELSVGDYAETLNWAHDQGYLKNSEGELWTDGDIYIDEGDLKLAVNFEFEQCPVEYKDDTFTFEFRSTDRETSEPLVNHPVYLVSWYGAVAYCNWLSEKRGYTSAYDLSTWELLDNDTLAPGTQFTDGYRLPTEAEWERAAGWGGLFHYTYSYQGFTIGGTLCNYTDLNQTGLTTIPTTTPVGFFNGVNTIPGSELLTSNAVSPVGAYDMSGNLFEWCHDRYDSGYYEISPTENPLGPESSSSRVVRGGSWNVPASLCRSAFRFNQPPDFTVNYVGIRLARTPKVPKEMWTIF